MHTRGKRTMIGATVLALLLAGCGGSGGSETSGRSAGPPASGAEGTAAGTISVTIDSGPLAGTHGGVGAMTCGHGKFGGDEIWLVFSTDIDDANDLTMANVFSAPEDEKDNAQSPYRGQALVLEVGIGNFMADAGKKLVINGDHPGSTSAREVDGNMIRVTGTTNDGTEIQVAAHCNTVETS